MSFREKIHKNIDLKLQKCVNFYYRQINDYLIVK